LPADIANIPYDPVDLVLDLFEALGKGAKPPLESLNIAGGRQVKRSHRCLLRLQGLLTGAKSRSHRVLENLAVEERLRELANCLLATGPQSLWVVVLH